MDDKDRVNKRDIDIANLVGLRAQDITPTILLVIKRTAMEFKYNYNAAQYVKNILKCN